MFVYKNGGKSTHLMRDSFDSSPGKQHYQALFSW